MAKLLLIAVVIVAGCGRIGFEQLGAGTGGTGDDDGSGHGSESGPGSGSGSNTSVDCTTLAVDACERAVGCAPLMCPACPCGSIAFQSCAPSGDATRPSCAALACSCCDNDTPCGAPAHCSSTLVDPRCNNACFGSGSSETCAMCGGVICGQLPTTACVICTTDVDCPALDTCSSSLCVARTCTTTDQCAVDQTCNGSNCVEATCASDADCFGSCVNSHCEASQGECESSMPG